MEFEEGDTAYYYNGYKFLKCKIHGFTSPYYICIFEKGIEVDGKEVPNSFRAIDKREICEFPRIHNLKVLLDD
jgi:hypothetical protein